MSKIMKKGKIHKDTAEWKDQNKITIVKSDNTKRKKIHKNISAKEGTQMIPREGQAKETKQNLEK